MFLGLQKEDLRPIEEIVREKLLQILESAYPNVLSVEDLCRYVADMKATELLAFHSFQIF